MLTCMCMVLVCTVHIRDSHNISPMTIMTIEGGAVGGAQHNF